MPDQISFYPEPTNQHRSDAAEKVLASFAQNDGEVDLKGRLGELSKENLTDLLADIAHYCDRHGQSLHACLATAKYHYLEETNDFGTQFDEPAL